MKVMRWIFVFVTLLHVPLNMFATRDQVYTTFKQERSKSNHVLFSVGITLFAFLIPVLKPDVIAILGFFGGVFATSVCLAFPFLIAVRMRQQSKEGSLILKFTFAFSIFIIFGSTWLSLFPNVIPGFLQSKN